MIVTYVGSIPNLRVIYHRTIFFVDFLEDSARYTLTPLGIESCEGKTFCQSVHHCDLSGPLWTGPDELGQIMFGIN